MDETWVRKGGLPILQFHPPITIRALDDSILQTVSALLAPLSMVTSGNHKEKLEFLIFKAPAAPLVFDHPWLSRHNPSINCSNSSLSGWSLYCHAQCLVSACSSLSSSSLFQEEKVDLSWVHVEYHKMRELFSKSRASSLPPDRPYDCAINLLPSSSPPRGRLFSLSAPERAAMEKHLSESLAAGIIHSSSSPAVAGFFFVKQKDGSLCPSIDYRGPNDITVKNRYPLQLMSSAIELLQGAKFFIKLDLHNA